MILGPTLVFRTFHHGGHRITEKDPDFDVGAGVPHSEVVTFFSYFGMTVDC